MEARVAVVTGATSGIGLDVTRRLLDRGDAVVAVSRRARERATLAPSSRLELVDGDVADPQVAARAIDAAIERFGRLDLLVNNAGIFQAKPFVDYDDRDAAALVATNLTGFVRMTQAALRKMAVAGRGHVVTVTTSLVAQPIAGVPCALPILIKGGLEAATRSLAIEYAGRGVRVNAVAPGIVDTPMHPAANHAALAKLSPAARIARADEISSAILWLDGAEFVSGEVVHVDGGAHAGRW